MTDSVLGYAHAAPLYWRQGWKGVLPIPPRQKWPPPDGWTGYEGKWPSFPDIQAWSDTKPANSNLGLRLPNDVVGIDVDAYDTKTGGLTLHTAEALWGPLPATYRSSSRVDSISSIRFYRIPPGTLLESVISFDLPTGRIADIEIVQLNHRYAIVWPSIHKDTGRLYRWITPDGFYTTDIPRSHDLAELPAKWVERLSRTAIDITAHADVNSILTALPPGQPSILVMEQLGKALLGLTDGSAVSRHDTTRDHVLRMFRLAEQGQEGVGAALGTLREQYITAVANRDGSSAAAGEFDRMVTGQRGHDLIASTPTVDPYELAGLARPKTPTTNQDFRVQPILVIAEPVVHVELDEFDRLLFDVPEQVTEGLPETKTSWAAVDLVSILAGDLTPEEPTELLRTDGKPLFYRGRINALVGESESGKSWVALHACAQAMKAGRSVVFIDFEDMPGNVVGRLLGLGLTPELLQARFAYVGPYEPLGTLQQEELLAVLARMRPSVTVVDGVNAAMTLLGLDLEKNKEATQFHQLVLKPLADPVVSDTAVVVVDHVIKNPIGRGAYAIGAQAKRAMIDGTMIEVVAVEPFGRGRKGKLRLTVMKDKPGGVRAIASERGRIGDVLIDATNVDAILISVLPPEEEKVLIDGIEIDAQINMDMLKVANFLAGTEEPVNRQHMLIEIGLPPKKLDVAIGQLRELKYLAVTKGPKNSNLHAMVRVYGGRPVDEVDFDVPLE